MLCVKCGNVLSENETSCNLCGTNSGLSDRHAAYLDIFNQACNAFIDGHIAYPTFRLVAWRFKAFYASYFAKLEELTEEAEQKELLELIKHYESLPPDQKKQMEMMYEKEAELQRMKDLEEENNPVEVEVDPNAPVPTMEELFGPLDPLIQAEVDLGAAGESIQSIHAKIQGIMTNIQLTYDLRRKSYDELVRLKKEGADISDAFLEAVKLS